MKSTILIPILLLCYACGDPDSNKDLGHYIVETEVQVKEGHIQDVLKLFSSTNPELVAGESDWVKATLSVVEKKDIIIVRAYWKDKLSYLKFSSTDAFRNTMKEFSQHFESRPKVTISKVLFAM